MFREMRRMDRALDEAGIERVLENGEYGLFASYGDNGFPYAIPYSYAILDGKIYLHCTSMESLCKDNLRYCERVCFTVVGKTELLPGQFATCFESVVVFGTARELADAELKTMALRALIKKYSADHILEGERYINKLFDVTSVLEITPLHTTGKARYKNGKSNQDYLNRSGKDA